MSRGLPRRRDDHAVSNVLGAVLMFGLLVLTLVVIQVRFVPVWGEDREARHMQALADDLRQLKSDVDRQAANDTTTTITASLALQDAGGFRFFSGTSSNTGATAEFVPSPTGTGIQMSSTKPIQILRRNGVDLFSAGNVWDPELTEDGDTEITNILSVQHLRQRIDMDDAGDSYIGGPSGNDYADGDSVTIEVFAADDDVDPIATIVTTAQKDSSEYTFTIRVLDEAGTEVSSDSESLFQQVQIDYLYFDLLGDSLFLEPMLAANQAPFRITLDEDGLQGEYQIVYTDSDSGAIGGNAGILDTAGISSLESSGRLELDSTNQHYVDQTYILEHGAIVLEQGSDDVLLVPPALDAGMGTEGGTINWVIGGLTGDGLAVDADRVSAVASTEGAAVDVWILAPQATLTIPTLHADAWADYFDAALQDAGWTAGQYTLTESSANLRVDLEGPVANDPSCTAAATANCVYDVSIRFRVSPIDLALSAGG